MTHRLTACLASCGLLHRRALGTGAADTTTAVRHDGSTSSKVFVLRPRHPTAAAGSLRAPPPMWLFCSSSTGDVRRVAMKPRRVLGVRVLRQKRDRSLLLVRLRDRYFA